MHIVLAVEKINNTHGSMERTVVNLANYLTKIDHEVTILTFDENNNGAPVYPISSGVKSHNLELIESNSYKKKYAERSDIKQCMPNIISDVVSNLSAIKRIFTVSKKEVPIVAQALKRLKPDVVVSFQSHFHRYIIPAAKQAGIPVIASEHKPPMSLYRQHINMIDRIVIFSCLKVAEKVRVLLPEFTEDYPANIRGKCVAIPNGITLKGMVGAAAQDDKKNITTKTIISVGESHMKKYYETLIHSFARIASDFPEWHLKVFGNVDRNSKLANLITEYDLEDQIFLVGEVVDMKERYENAEIYAMPSLFRGFSNVILEAISAGLPIVAVNDVTSNPVKVVEDGVSGVLVPEGNNVKNLAQGLSKLMSNDALRESMSQATIEKAAYFDMDKVLKQWQELLISCCK